MARPSLQARARVHDAAVGEHGGRRQVARPVAGEERHDAADLARLGSPVSAVDIAAHSATRPAPLQLDIVGATLFNTAPPTQGMASLLILALFEYYYYASAQEAPEAQQFRHTGRVPTAAAPAHAAAQSQNVFGVTVIAVAAVVVGLGIFSLGLASEYNRVVMTVGSVIFLLAGTGLFRIRLAASRRA